MKQAEDGVDLFRWALPIGGGQREQRERVNAQARRGGDNSPGGLRAGAVSGGSWQPARGGPTAVSIGNDGNVERAGGRFWRDDAGRHDDGFDRCFER